MAKRRFSCDICNVLIPPHAHYIVQMEIYFNPDVPEITQEELDEMDSAEEMRKLIEQMRKLTPEEAQDQVYRRFDFKICPKCQRELLVNPLGLPRQRPIGEN